MRIELIGPPDRIYSVWIGVLVLSMCTFKEVFISKNEYNEAVHLLYTETNLHCKHKHQW